jgi:diguanylate cyclase (GGDEF)-like protein
MTPLSLILLIPALPLFGVFVGPVAVWILSGLSWGGLFGAAMIAANPTQKIIFLLQVPCGILVTFAALHLAKRLRAPAESSGGGDALGQLAQMKARHASLKAQVTRAEQEENRSLQIYGLAKSLAEALSWKDMAPRLSTGVQKVFGSQEFLLYSMNEKGRWELLHRRGSWSKEPPISGTVPAASQFLYPPQTQEVVPVQSVPILSPDGDGRIMGLLFLKCATEKPSEDMLQVGHEFGEQLGMVLSKAMLFNQMEMHSRIDGLTGVLRRQAFMDRLGDEIKKANAFHSPFSLFMVDIDHFKSVNDGHGHAAGDAVLSRVGQILKESVYETDVVGRYGGEEFIVLLPRAEAQGVGRKAEQLRQRFEREIISSGFEQLRITVSIGIAHFPTHGRTADDLIARADAALYQAKETGRNKVVAA